jgi:hypothetical protein
VERLLPALEAAGQPGRAARVVMISGAAMNGTIHFDDVNFTRRFSILRAVSQFCAANDVFTAELSRRMALCTDQLRVSITCLKIGVVTIFLATCVFSTRRLLTGLSFVGILMIVILTVRIAGMMVDFAVREDMKLVRAEIGLVLLASTSFLIKLKRRINSSKIHSEHSIQSHPGASLN